MRTQHNFYHIDSNLDMHNGNIELIPVKLSKESVTKPVAEKRCSLGVFYDRTDLFGCALAHIGITIRLMMGALPFSRCSSVVVQNVQAHARESTRWTHNGKKTRVDA
jgi:hypothetical protein